VRLEVSGAGPRYEVHLTGALSGLGAALAEVSAPGPCVLVTNPVVAPLHAEAAEAALRAAGFAPVRVLVPDGEARKDLAAWSALVEDLLAAGADRRTPVLALGGGVTGDLTGFAAATTLRGLPFVQVPTTLLAMVDSSVGGKTGVNTARGKNLVGAFHPPVLVYAAFETLATLDDAELRCGLGEVVKHAVIAGDDALRACEDAAEALRARDPDALRAVVADAVRVKASIVAEDPYERGRRAILNLGHTVGHALETVCGYGALRHGEAVAIGLLAEARWAARAGLLRDPALPDRIAALLGRLGLPTVPPQTLSLDALVRAAGFDKKRERGTLRVIVPIAPGAVEPRSVEAAEVPGLFASLPVAAESS
jgi:3-dehydroquinate synthase